MKKEKIQPDYIPNIVRQALAWLDRMKIAYRYIPEAHLWEFVYDGLYLLLMNDCKDDEFGIYAPTFITDSDDVEIQKMVYECSEPVIDMEFSSNCDIGYDGDGACHVAQWWGYKSEKPRFTRKVFVEKLKEMHDCQLKLYFILHCTYEGMFNPPKEVMKEIFKDLRTDESNE